MRRRLCRLFRYGIDVAFSFTCRYLSFRYALMFSQRLFFAAVFISFSQRHTRHITFSPMLRSAFGVSDAAAAAISHTLACRCYAAHAPSFFFSAADDAADDTVISLPAAPLLIIFALLMLSSDFHYLRYCCRALLS